MDFIARRTPDDGSNIAADVFIDIKVGNGPWQLFDNLVLDVNNDHQVQRCYSQNQIPPIPGNQYQFRVRTPAGRRIFTNLTLAKYTRFWQNVTEEVGGLRVKKTTSRDTQLTKMDSSNCVLKRMIR